jgi:4-hydroxy-3-methylbut-2-enyl diphosphate reductase
MKKFEIPELYRSSIISKVKEKRKLEDPRKKDFSPSIIDLGTIQFHIARHFGFCYGVENAIEIAYKAINENPDKQIYLLSQMIHNPDVNKDLESQGVRFIQDTHGEQLIPWENIRSEDIVIIPAFGTTVAIEQKLAAIGVDVAKYNTTCPFVEKVWNRSEKLGMDKHTIIIHGKQMHEETRATFSRSELNAPSLVIKDINEAKLVGEFILGQRDIETFATVFEGKFSEGFDPKLHLSKIGVVNQTTMLASETQEITDYLRTVMLSKFGEENSKQHIADTRDTLCYATNDNQSATYGLMKVDADLAIVIGGYNSSNTKHLVELLEQKFTTFYIKSKEEILESGAINSFNIHTKEMEEFESFLPENKDSLKIIITSGASCPDAVVDGVLQRIIDLTNPPISIADSLTAFLKNEVAS